MVLDDAASHEDAPLKDSSTYKDDVVMSEDPDEESVSDGNSSVQTQRPRKGKERAVEVSFQKNSIFTHMKASHSCPCNRMTSPRSGPSAFHRVYSPQEL